MKMFVRLFFVFLSGNEVKRKERENLWKIESCKY